MAKTGVCVGTSPGGRDVRFMDDMRADLRDKALSLVERLANNPAGAKELGGKKLQCCRELLSFRLNHKYRLVVAIDDLPGGPYRIMGHTRYDQLLRRLGI